jgi:hypothetical protein
VLGLVLIDVSHNGQNITDRVVSVLADYGLTEKVFAVILDNASYNTVAMQKLRSIQSKYLGFEVIDELEYASSNAVNFIFLHQRCVRYIINLIVRRPKLLLSL